MDFEKDTSLPKALRKGVHSDFARGMAQMRWWEPQTDFANELDSRFLL